VRHNRRRHKEWSGISPHSTVQIRGEIIADESGRGHDIVSPSKPAKRQIAQAAAHRIANDEGSAEHGHSRCDTERDGKVRAPVIRGAPADEG
jgi:hypothetical protein